MLNVPHIKQIIPAAGWYVWLEEPHPESGEADLTSRPLIGWALLESSRVVGLVADTEVNIGEDLPGFLRYKDRPHRNLDWSPT
jgi:hypothetical protein